MSQRRLTGRYQSRRQRVASRAGRGWPVAQAEKWAGCGGVVENTK